MATAKNVLDDIGENFLLCSICLEHFKEPKLLPCLHRFCKKCLDDYILKHGDDLNCPVCQKMFSVPEEGFKTDFCVKNITEYVQLKQSLGTEKVQQCSGCLKELKVTAFCLKCHGFLCRSCHDFHVTNTIAKEHRQHVIILDSFEPTNLTMERLVSLKKSPECSIHPEKASELCCKSCNNQPVCMACGTFGKHKGHDLYELTSLAEDERVKLIEKMSALNELREKIYTLPGTIAEMKEKLDATMTSKKEELSSTFEEKQQKMKERAKAISENYNIEKNKLEELFQTKTSVLKRELEKEICLLTERYDKACGEEKRERDELLQMSQGKMEREKVVLEKNLMVAQETVDKLLAECSTKQQERQKQINEIADKFEKVIERFENVQSTASSILAAKHDWADMQCIPNICEAIDELTEDIVRDKPNNISDVSVECLPLSLIGRIVVSEKAETIVKANLEDDAAGIDDITGNDYGSTVVSGEYQEGKVHITVLSADGRKLRQMVTKSKYGYRFCCFLGGAKVSTIAKPGEIGIYDINDGSYFNTNIPGVIQGCPANHKRRKVSCVATNFANNLLVGCAKSRELYVFDSKLKFLHKLTLPELIKGPRGLAVHEGNLLVCDNSKVAMVISMTKPHNVIYQFKKPDVDGDDCSPRRVCTGDLGYVYILWESPNTIAQYSSDGNLKASRSVSEGPVRSITTVIMDGVEKLLVATNKKIMTYSLSYS